MIVCNLADLSCYHIFFRFKLLSSDSSRSQLTKNINITDPSVSGCFLHFPRLWQRADGSVAVSAKTIIMMLSISTNSKLKFPQKHIPNQVCQLE